MMKRQVNVGSDVMQIDEDRIEFLRPGMGWTPRSTGATGNQYAGLIRDPRTARIVAYHLLLWAEETDTGRSAQ